MAAAAQLELAPHAASVSLAREFVLQRCQHLGRDLVEDAMLLVSELVSNAILHGQPVIVLTVRMDPDAIEVKVTDNGETLPAPPGAPADSRQTRGRGLHLVAALSTQWGVTPKAPPPGKSVWFSLAAAPAARSSEPAEAFG